MATEPIIRVLILHRSQLFADALCGSFATTPSITLAGLIDARNLDDTDFGDVEADVVLIDASPVDDAVVGSISALHEQLPEARLVPVGLRDDDDVVRLIEAGACGFLTIESSFRDLVELVEAVHRGQAPSTPSVVASVVARIAELSGKRPTDSPPSDGAPGLLTPREYEVLGLLSEGLINKEIASRLGISVATVKCHVHRILDKLDAKSRREAIAQASRRGLLKIDTPWCTAS